MPEDLRGQEHAWDEWLQRVRVGVTDRDEHTNARAAAVLEELAALPARAGRTILDVGCGDGYDSVQFARYGRVTGTDLAPATIADANQRYDGSGVTFVAGDFLTLDFPSAPFDVVVTLETIAHVYDQAAFVGRCAQLLRPGGHLIVTTQNRDVHDFLGHPPARGYLRHWLDRDDLARLLARHLNVQRIRTVDPADSGSIQPNTDGRRPPPWLRLAYSYRANRLIQRVVPVRWLDRIKERAGLGCTLVAVATRS